MKDEFGIVQDCGNGEWHWVQSDGKFRMTVGGPGSLTYPDYASAERDRGKMIAGDPKVNPGNLTIVKVSLTDDEKQGRHNLLAEGNVGNGMKAMNGIEAAIWQSVNAFNRAQLSVEKPPATCDEIIKAIAHALKYALTYLSFPDEGYGDEDLERVDHGDVGDLVDRLIEELRCVRLPELPDIKEGKLLQWKPRRQ